MKRWSKLKKKIENVFVPELDLQIHCNVYTTTTVHETFKAPRTWLQCDKKILFDFPGMFFLWKNPEERGSVRYMEEDTPDLGILIDDYLATPKLELLEAEFLNDRWRFTDFLKIADRRIGKERLTEKYGHFPPRHPLGALLLKRISADPILEICLPECRFIDLDGNLTGLPNLIRVKTLAICDGYSDPRELPTLRVLRQSRGGDVQFSIRILDQPTVLEEHLNWWEYKHFSPEDLQKIYAWIAANKTKLENFWQNGMRWTAEATQEWTHSLTKI